MCTHALAHAHVYAHMEVPGPCQGSSSIILYTIFWDMSSHWTCSQQFQLDWPVCEPWALPVSTSIWVLGLQMHTSTSGCIIRCWGSSNCGKCFPHGYTSLAWFLWLWKELYVLKNNECMAFIFRSHHFLLTGFNESERQMVYIAIGLLPGMKFFSNNKWPPPLTKYFYWALCVQSVIWLIESLVGMSDAMVGLIY